MAGAQQQHGLALEFFGVDGFALRQRVRPGHSHQEGLFVQRGHGQVGVHKGLGQDGAVQLTRAQHVQQLDGEVLLQDQGHLRHPGDGGPHQIRQQIRPDGVDDPQAQGAGQRVFATLGDLLDGVGLLQNGLGLTHDLVAQRGDADLGRAALEELHIQLFFQLLHGHRQGGLRDKTGLGSTPEVLFPGHGHDVSKFGQGHAAILRQAKAALPHQAQAFRYSDLAPSQRAT